MGNVNGREDGGDDSDSNPSGVEDGGSAVDDMAEQYPSQVRGQTRGDGELMGQSPPPSPRAAQSPLMFAPQVPVLPLQRPDEMHMPSNSWMQTSPRYEEVGVEQGIPTMITWSCDAKEVAVEGSWDDWKSRKPLQRSGKDFTLMKVLPSGVYHYRFIVDGQRRHAPDVLCAVDENGQHYNILDLQDYVPEDVGSISGFEPPQSPESTYNNYQLDSEDYSKEPPFVPPHLQMTLLNVPSSYMEIPPPLSRPQHVVLNHLYMQKGRNSPSQVALGSTHRFLAKYVTVVLYKPIQR